MAKSIKQQLEDMEKWDALETVGEIFRQKFIPLFEKGEYHFYKHTWNDITTLYLTDFDNGEYTSITLEEARELSKNPEVEGNIVKTFFEYYDKTVITLESLETEEGVAYYKSLSMEDKYLQLFIPLFEKGEWFFTKSVKGYGKEIVLSFIDDIYKN